MLETILTLAIGLLLPIAAIATVVTLPFADRITQIQQSVTYLTLVAAVVIL